MRTRSWKRAAFGLLAASATACGSSGSATNSTPDGAADGLAPVLDAHATMDSGRTTRGDANVRDTGRDVMTAHEATNGSDATNDVATLDAGADTAIRDAAHDAMADAVSSACSSCSSSETCVDGACVACGTASEPCCAGETCSGSTLACANRTCVTCGSAGDPCCAGSACSSATLACAAGSCTACGGASEPCCTTGSACDSATLACAAGSCTACGGASEPCCTAGNACDSATLACAAGSCTACGGASEPCCGTTCGNDLTCNGGTCACGSKGESCCGGTTCDTENLACVGGSCACGGIEQVCCATTGGAAACNSTGAGGAPASCAPAGECSCLKACNNAEIQRTDGTLWDPSATNALTYDGVHPLLATSFSGSGNILGCAVDGTGAVWCWGPNNEFGQLGNGTTMAPQPSTQAHQVLTAAATPLIGITKVVVDPRQGFTACAIDTSQNLWCWGCPNFDLSTTSLYATKILTSSGGPAFTGVTDVAVGEFHDCAITSDGNLWCWGANDTGQLGDGDTTGTTKTYPTKVPYFQTNNLQVTQVSVGSNGSPGSTEGLSCATTSAGNAYCWGSNGTGGLEGSINASSWVYSPFEMVTAAGGAPLAHVSSVQIVSGSASPCAVTTSGVLCWGALPHLANWPSPYYPGAYQEGGSFTPILTLCGSTGYGNAGTPGTTFLDTNGIYHEGGEAYTGVNSPQAVRCGP